MARWPSFEERFARCMPDPTEGDGCWLWRGSLTSGGYGQIRRGASVLYAHRLVYEMHFGPIPDGMKVCHTCDNPPCVRPDHFFLGTQADNLADMARKGRARGPRLLGSRQHRAKLNESAVAAVRALAPLPGERKMAFYRRLASEYGVRAGTIRGVISGRGWAHV